MSGLSDLTVDERKRVQQAMTRAFVPGALISAAGGLINEIGRGSHSVPLVICALLMIGFGITISLTMGLRARRHEIATVEAERAD